MTGISGAAIACLKAYAWPGNIRELENAMERAVALERTPSILVESLPDQLRGVRRGRRPRRRRAIGAVPGSRLRPRAARPAHRARIHRRSPAPRRRRQGQGGRAPRDVLPVVPLLHEEVRLEVEPSGLGLRARAGTPGSGTPAGPFEEGLEPFEPEPRALSPEPFAIPTLSDNRGRHKLSARQKMAAIQSASCACRSSITDRQT